MRRAIRWFAAPLVTVGTCTALAACGGGYGTPTAPGGTPGASGATITIANNSITPRSVTVRVGQSVTFVNNNGRAHNVSSDPHPTHTDCPAISAVGHLTSGQTRLTSALTVARTCGFHDHDDPDNAAFRGTIVVR